MPVGELAAPVVGGQVGFYPAQLLLGDRPRSRVDRHQMPVPHIEAVPTALLPVSGGSEVVEVPSRAGEVVLLVPPHPNPPPPAPPRGGGGSEVAEPPPGGGGGVVGVPRARPRPVREPAPRR